MRAIVQDTYGSADVLREADIDLPTPGEGEVLVRVHAAGVDRGVWHLMTGLPYLVRVAGCGLRRPKERVLGLDFSGRVETLGHRADGFGTNDEVFGVGRGAFADFALARIDRIAKKPARLGFEEAAAVPTSGLTALQALRDRAEVRPRQSVLILGASGGVGTFAVQIAKYLGAKVTGVCGPDKQDLVRSLGADHVFDYTQDDVTKSGGFYDAIIDLAGHRSLSRLRRILAPRGTLVIVGGEGGGRWLGGMGRPLRAMLLSRFVGQRLRWHMTEERREDLEVLSTLIESGAVRPVVDRVFPFAEVPEAIRHVEQGRARGKVVVSLDPLPTERDFDPVGGDPEAHRAWRRFGGLELEDARERFLDLPFRYMEDFLAMGPRAFAYYFPVLERYVESRLDMAHGGRLEDDSDLVTIAETLRMQFERDVDGQLGGIVKRVLELAGLVLGSIRPVPAEGWNRRQDVKAWRALCRTLKART